MLEKAIFLANTKFSVGFAKTTVSCPIDIFLNCTFFLIGKDNDTQINESIWLLCLPGTNAPS